MQRKQNRPEIIVGLFGLVTFLIIAYMSREVGDAPFVKAKGVKYFSYFDVVSGIIPKSPVEVAGIPVGYVDTIDLDNNRARVTLKIDPKVAIFEDARVFIRSRGVLGDQFMAVNPGTFGKQKLKEGDIITSGAVGGELGGLMDTMKDAAVNLRDLTKAVNEIVQEQKERGTFEKIFGNIDDMTTNLNEFIAGNTASMDTIVANMKDISTSLKRFVDTNVNEQLAESSIRLEKTITMMQEITAKVQRGEGTVGKLLNDETTVNRLNSALAGVEKFTSGVGRLQTEVGYRGEYLFSNLDLQNMVSLTLRPRPDKYFRLSLVNAAVGNATVTDTTISSPPGTVVSSTQTIERNNKVLFSLELAKRFYDVTFRFGLLRNSGGIGLDYSLLDDILTFSMEAFDFSRVNDSMHLRSYATLNLWQHLMVTAGVDDILNEAGDIDPFIGAGITFRDDDIRTLFGALSFSKF
jgi:phospholipid/cholesterol/gamma-HCH transport system substrate-binding protein